VLDIRTLYVAHVAVILTAGMVMLLSRHWQPGARSVGTWGGGAVCLGVGMALTALRGIAPDWLTVLVANGIAAMCPLMIWNGVRKFNGRPTRWRQTLALASAFVASLAYYLYVDESLSARIVIASLLLAGASGASAFELLHNTNPALRRMSWTAATALVLVMAAQLGRAATTATGGSQFDLFAPTLANQVSYLAGIVVSSLVIFCLAMMANQQLQIEIAEHSAELERIARDRDQARHRAEQANRAKSVFLTMMSHELRTPLNVILGFSELGPAMPSTPPLPERIKEYFGLIHESGEHLLRMINDILDLSKVEAGKMEIECADLEVEYVINSTVRLVSQQASNQGQHLKVTIDSPAPALFADERAVRQILFNLLSNAVRFTPEGGTIRVHAAAIAEGGAELVVSDTGAGIPRDQIARLTQPFEQIDNSYQRAHGGTGLGLPLVDALVRLHGGTLTIDSEICVGTRVSVRFPSGPQAQDSSVATLSLALEKRGHAQTASTGHCPGG
jgi:signal transduction histidine kinase